MDKSIFKKHRGLLGKARWLTGAGLLALVAIAVVLALGSAQAAGAAQGRGDRSRGRGARHPYEPRRQRAHTFGIDGSGNPLCPLPDAAKGKGGESSMTDTVLKENR